MVRQVASPSCELAADLIYLLWKSQAGARACIQLNNTMAFRSMSSRRAENAPPSASTARPAAVKASATVAGAGTRSGSTARSRVGAAGACATASAAVAGARGAATARALQPAAGGSSRATAPSRGAVAGAGAGKTGASSEGLGMCQILGASTSTVASVSAASSSSSSGSAGAPSASPFAAFAIPSVLAQLQTIFSTGIPDGFGPDYATVLGKGFPKKKPDVSSRVRTVNRDIGAGAAVSPPMRYSCPRCSALPVPG